jgi:membrane protease subunit HflK
MSWNEPGDNKKDPWSGRDQQETPPDLEEVMRSLQEKLAGLFGGGGGGNDSGGNSKTVIAALGAAALVIWALTGIYIVDEGNRGVVTRFGKYVETTQPGPHWRLPAPIESHTIVNVEQQRFIEVGYRSNTRQQTSQSFAKEALMLTQDENIVDVRLSVQYQIKDAKNYLFNLADPDITLRQVTESAERAVIGKNTMDFVLTEGRSSFADEMKVEIQRILDDYNAGIRVMAVSVKDAQPPEEVQSAFEDAIKAREDEQRLKNEAEAYANEVVPKARGAAARLTEESEGYKLRVIAKAKGEAGRFEQLLTEYQKSPDITRQRLYLDTMEGIFDKTNTVLLDVKGGNNMFYLPIDKLQRPGTAAEPAKDNETTQTYQDMTDSVAKNVRGTAVRGREGRAQ